MDDKEGIGTANITLGPGRKTCANQACTGVGIVELTVYGPAGAAAVADEYARAQKSYDSNPTAKLRRFRSRESPPNKDDHGGNQTLHAEEKESLILRIVTAGVSL